MKKLTTITLIVASLAAQAYAGDANEIHSNKDTPNYRGVYVEANAGTNAYYLGVFSSEGHKTHAGINGFGWSTAVGYTFTRYVGIEGGFMQNYVNVPQDNDVDCDDSGCQVHSNKNKTFHGNTGYVAGRFVIPMGQSFEVITKAGMMAVSATEKKSNGSNETHWLALPYLGVGLGYKINQHIELTTQYQGAVYGVAGAGLFSAGMTYHF